jgi:hypothetical protein
MKKKPLTMLLCGVLLLSEFGLAVAASEESTDKFNPDIFPRFYPKTDQSPDQGGTQKNHQLTEFEMAVDHCVEKVRKEFPDTKFDVYANGESRRYGSDKKVDRLWQCMKRAGYSRQKE